MFEHGRIISLYLCLKLRKTSRNEIYMGIKEAIKQSTFRSSRQKAMLNMLYTHNWMLQHIRGFMAGANLTHQQYNVLRILRGSHPKPLSTLQIRDRMLDKMSDTSRIVDRLIKKKLVKKTACEDDRRLVDIAITTQGMAVLQELDGREQELDELLGGLSESEAETLSALLDKLRATKEEEEPPPK